MALICVMLGLVRGTALAADVSTPVACGSNGCTSLPTSTLQGLLTLPAALQPVEAPRARPFVLFRVADAEGGTHEVVYVRRDHEALLGFAGGQDWRLVPADDAQLLADASAGRTPYAAPASGTPLGRVFASEESRGRKAGWLAIIALAVALVAVAAYVGVTTVARRSG